MKSWLPAGVAFLVAGVLELMFLALSVLGTLLGGVMTGAALFGEMGNGEAFVGPVVFLFYGVWLIATLLAGPIHIAAGVMILRGRRNRTLLWVAIVASVLPLATVYCAPTSIVAGVLGLVAVITSTPRPDGDPVGGAS